MSGASSLGWAGRGQAASWVRELDRSPALEFVFLWACMKASWRRWSLSQDFRSQHGQKPEAEPSSSYCVSMRGRWDPTELEQGPETLAQTPEHAGVCV